MQISFLSSRSPTEAQAAVNAFRSGLGEVGYFEGKNVIIEFRWAEGRHDRLPALGYEQLAGTERNTSKRRVTNLKRLSVELLLSE